MTPSDAFRLDEAIAVLERAPAAYRALLGGLPDAWLFTAEGPGTWSPYDIIGHLIHGERTDWMVRTRHILAHGEAVPFLPFDREAMLAEPQGNTLAELLDTFEMLRAENLAALHALHLTEADFARAGRHPALGRVTLVQLLATWVAHDLSHLAQVSRVMGKRYRDLVGPWREYLPMLDR